MTQKPRKLKVTLGSWNQRNFTVVHPRTSLEACALDARLGNGSISILDPRLRIPLLLFKENGYKPSPQWFPGSFGWTSFAYDWLMFALNIIDQTWLTLVHLNHVRSHCTQSLSLFSLECLRWGLRTNPLWLELVEKLKNTFICSSLAVLWSTQSDMFLRKKHLRNKLKNKVNSISYLAGTLFRSL